LARSRNSGIDNGCGGCTFRAGGRAGTLA
jgi:hypothetical protein